MIELLVLFVLSRKVLTMYGISKEIRTIFSPVTTPSFGTIGPALKRLTKNGSVKTQKILSPGGRRSVYYSITNTGINELKDLVMAEPVENPVHFLVASRVKIICADVLNKEELKKTIAKMKIKAESIMIDINNLQENDEYSFFPKVVFNNLYCEYKNFIYLLEDVERAGSN